MGWNKLQYTKPERKQLRHARVHLGADRCEDCGRMLRATHQVLRFGRRCRPCFVVYTDTADLVVGVL